MINYRTGKSDGIFLFFAIITFPQDSLRKVKTRRRRNNVKSYQEERTQ